MMRMGLLVLSAAMLSPSAFAQAYRWTDPASGKTVVSDHPPPPNAKAVAKARDVGSNPEGWSYATRKAATDFPVVLFTTADCLDICRDARSLLQTRGIPFSEKILKNEEEANEVRALFGNLYVPALKVGREAIKGFDAPAYHNLLDLAGYPKQAAPGSRPPTGLNP